MFATIRRYEGVDTSRIDELNRKVNETLLPKLSNLPGFKSYTLIGADHGVMSSFGIFETAEQGTESTRVVAEWLREEKLDTIVPNDPKITSGNVLVHKNGIPVSV
jgi:hypothetical protein